LPWAEIGSAVLLLAKGKVETKEVRRDKNWKHDLATVQVPGYHASKKEKRK
jgi:hypothetical protein